MARRVGTSPSTVGWYAYRKLLRDAAGAEVAQTAADDAQPVRGKLRAAVELLALGAVGFLVVTALRVLVLHSAGCCAP